MMVWEGKNIAIFGLSGCLKHIKSDNIKLLEGDLLNISA
jgi:hypothetical protein